jgi:hypothetical protein
MNVDQYLDTLARQLAEAAAVGGPETVELAERLAAPLRATARLVIQDALSDAMTELTLDLAPGTAEMRLHGRELSFVVSGAVRPGDDPTPMTEATPAEGAGAWPAAGSSVGEEPGDADPGDSGTARITFRPPDRLKAQIEAAAERESLSVNAFLIRTLTGVLRPSPPPPPSQPSSASGGNRLDGWVI